MLSCFDHVLFKGYLPITNGPALEGFVDRLATWFPFTVQVYVNGHSWLEKQMLKRHIGFHLRDNAFTALDDPEAAQKPADSFGHLNWPKILNRLVRQVNPLMKERWLRGYSYYLVIDQAEYATNLIFNSREAFAGLYSRLLDHAAINFSARDILTFLGRRFHPRFEREVLTSCQKDRWPGARIKHRMKNNESAGRRRWPLCQHRSTCAGNTVLVFTSLPPPATASR